MNYKQYYYDEELVMFPIQKQGYEIKGIQGWNTFNSVSWSNVEHFATQDAVASKSSILQLCSNPRKILLTIAMVRCCGTLLSPSLLVAAAGAVSVAAYVDTDNGIAANANASLFWGTYRPNIYFGTRTRSAETLLTGLMWHGLSQYDDVRRKCISYCIYRIVQLTQLLIFLTLYIFI
jgi:hypothetical protein